MQALQSVLSKITDMSPTHKDILMLAAQAARKRTYRRHHNS